jgi:hypothetical protein
MLTISIDLMVRSNYVAITILQFINALKVQTTVSVGYGILYVHGKPQITMVEPEPDYPSEAFLHQLV